MRQSRAALRGARNSAQCKKPCQKAKRKMKWGVRGVVRLGCGVLLCAAAAKAIGAPPAQPQKRPPTTNSAAPANFNTGQFHLKPGFKIELVAGEGLVAAPAAMAFDENGRLFVAEMRDYSRPGEEAAGMGRIRLLQDTDNDGAIDSTRVYADNLPHPSAIACYGGGVFVATGREILYLKDSRQDGSADIRRSVFTLSLTTNS